MNNEYVNFKKLEHQLIKLYEKKYSNIDPSKIETFELFNKIENLKFLCDNLCKRIEKSKYKKEILKFFANEYLNVLCFEELILDTKKILEADSFNIYYKFLNDKLIEIDDESDLKFYKSLECYYNAIMF